MCNYLVGRKLSTYKMDSKTKAEVSLWQPPYKFYKHLICIYGTSNTERERD